MSTQSVEKKPAKGGLKPKQISPTGYCRICGSPLDYLKLFWMIILTLPNSFFVQCFTVKPCQVFILVIKVQIDYFNIEFIYLLVSISRSSVEELEIHTEG